ncbi:MAG TPA: hypothetical protein VLG45_09105 [Thermodesulfobacteriota bacterium]|nr:hypothetical protein [Thermodesulfobacteriota bacterium]
MINLIIIDRVNEIYAGVRLLIYITVLYYTSVMYDIIIVSKTISRSTKN